MIHRDYILRMIEEGIQVLARIVTLRKGQLWNEVRMTLDAEFHRLTGADARAVARFSETELLARLMPGEPTLIVRYKALYLTRLLIEAGEAAAAEGHFEEGHECKLKALHLLLDVLSSGEAFEFPDFVPKVDILRDDLQTQGLSTRTHAMLMQYHERTGEFAKAEDDLHAMFEAEPGNKGLIEFGIGFYRRLLAQTDHALEAGNLPRAEVQEGLNELDRKTGGGVRE